MTDKIPISSEEAVGVLLGATGLAASEDEVRALARSYPDVRSMIDSLYAVAEARYEVPALHFEPRPLFSPWAMDPEAVNSYEC